MEKYLGENTPKLGFGLMRLPKLESGEIDIEQVKKMVDLFMEAGLTYFDTAYVYDNGKSEEAAKAALVDRYPREKFTLATKLNARVATTVEEARQQLYTSLERTGAGYFKGREGEGAYQALGLLFSRRSRAAGRAADQASGRRVCSAADQLCRLGKPQRGIPGLL